MEFENKVVLITGGASGIGKVTALEFAKLGATVVVADINESGGNETVSEIEEKGAKGTYLSVDIADHRDVKKMISSIIEKYGKLDIAINNAGIGGQSSKTEDATFENWDKVMSINASGVFYCMKYEIQEMLKQGSGIIVNTSSIAGLRGLPNSIAYSASKHAVIGMTKTAAMEYARKNIRINAICPVFTVTPLFNPEAMDKISDGLSDKLKKGIPMKRFGNPKEIAKSIIYLCSDASSFVTGHALPVDGGLMA